MRRTASGNHDRQTTVEVMRCEESRLKAAELALYAACKRLAAGLQEGEPYEREARSMLAKAQRNWVAFRDQDCKAMLIARGDASLRGWYHLNCMRNHAELRTRQLDAFRTD